MGTREVATPTGRALVAAAGVALTLVAGCGSDDYANEPRPAAPLTVGARIDDRSVQVSPSEFGAGIVSFTISNQSNAPAALTLTSQPSGTGPTLRRKQSATIQPGDVGSMQVELPPGDYLLGGAPESGGKPGHFTVGRNRPSSENDLLLP